MHKRTISCHVKTRGFTLTELAIVLGVAGLITGAIWIVSGTVSNNNKAYLTVQQVGRVAENIREYYMNAQGIPVAACNADITGTLDQTTTNTYTATGVFPDEMRNLCPSCAPYKYQINSPYVRAAGPAAGIGSGSLRIMGGSVCSGVAPNILASHFQVVLTNLTPAACAQLLFSGINYQDQTLGVTQVCAASEAGSLYPCYNEVNNSGSGGWSSLSCKNGVCGIGAVTPTSITLAQAQKFCTGSVAGYNGNSEVAWEFNVRH